MLSNNVILAIIALVSITEAAVNPWKAPGPDDSRGPCPMLNTLANHGYLYVRPLSCALKKKCPSLITAINVMMMILIIQTAPIMARTSR